MAFFTKLYKRTRVRQRSLGGLRFDRCPFMLFTTLRAPIIGTVPATLATETHAVGAWTRCGLQGHKGSVTSIVVSSRGEVTRTEAYVPRIEAERALSRDLRPIRELGLRLKANSAGNACPRLVRPGGSAVAVPHR